jgi:hypothetical protein
LRRAIGPYSDIKVIGDLYTELKSALSAAKDALEDVRPSENGAVDSTNVFYALQGPISNVSDAVGEIHGKLESLLVVAGDDNGI